MKPINMTAKQLAESATYTRRWDNEYSEELCRRHGNLDAYRKEPQEATKRAARAYGIIIF